MIQLIIAFSLAFGICYLAMPSIIRIARARGIVDTPDYRKAHSAIVPSFGGFGIFAGFTLVMLIMTPTAYLTEFRYLMTALIIMFMVGARDDLDPLTPMIKLIGQLISISILVCLADIRITSLHGFLGIYEIGAWVSYFLTTTAFIFFINSFNLIDGIDGLCSSISIFILATLGTWFASADHMFYALIAFSATGGTLAFLRYNISPSKVFMGDTGSLLLGTICSVLVFQMLDINSVMTSDAIGFESGIIVAAGLMILPAFDTIRVFTLRIVRGESPLLPDKNHIHHLLLKAGFSHMEATATLLCANVAFMILAVNCQYMAPLLFFTLLIIIAMALVGLLQLSIRYRSSGVIRTDP